MTDRLPTFDIDVTPESYCRWLVGRDGELPHALPAIGDAVPVSYLFFLRCQPAAAVSIHDVLGRDPDRGLFGGVKYECHAGVAVGDRVRSEAVVTERKAVAAERGDMILTTLVNEWTVNGAPAVTETVRMVDLPPGPPAAPGAGPDADAEMPVIAPTVRFTRKQIAWLTVETGDLNPLHVDRDYAVSRKFPDVVVPGTLIAPIVEKLLSDHAGSPVRMLDIRFRAATYPDEDIAVAAAEEKEGAWKFEVSGNRQVRAVGQAELGKAAT